MGGKSFNSSIIYTLFLTRNISFVKIDDGLHMHNRRVQKYMVHAKIAQGEYLAVN